MLKTIVYKRIITDKQLNNSTIEKQRKEIKNYCEEHQLTFIHNIDKGGVFSCQEQ